LGYKTANSGSEVIVVTLARSLLVALLIVTLVESPVMAAPSPAVAPPLGVILQSQGARVGSDSAVRGTTIFDGDRLETSDAGLLQVRFGLSQAYFLGKSAAVVHQSAPGFATDLTRGTVVLSSGPGEKFHVFADGATIQPSTAQATVAQVTWVGPKELILTSRKGTLQVSMGDEVQTVAEGSSYRMLIDPAAAAPPSPGPTPRPQTQAGGHNRFILVVIVAAIALVAIGVVLAVESPSAPTGLSASTQ
jgi:hypothetical protein